VVLRTGEELRYRSKSGIGGLRKRERRKAAGADRLITIHLGQIRLVHRAGTDVLRLNRGVQRLIDIRMWDGGERAAKTRI
jgi:hypothetical protein